MKNYEKYLYDRNERIREKLKLYTSFSKVKLGTFINKNLTNLIFYLRFCCLL